MDLFRGDAAFNDSARVMPQPIKLGVCLIRWAATGFPPTMQLLDAIPLLALGALAIARRFGSCSRPGRSDA